MLVLFKSLGSLYRIRLPICCEYRKDNKGPFWKDKRLKSKSLYH